LTHLHGSIFAEGSLDFWAANFGWGNLQSCKKMQKASPEYQKNDPRNVAPPLPHALLNVRQYL
jgi:hypothetical protein